MLCLITIKIEATEKIVRIKTNGWFPFLHVRKEKFKIKRDGHENYVTFGNGYFLVIAELS